MANKLELNWYGKYEQYNNIESRILIENKELSNIKDDIDTENMLIHGDNLLALKALETKFTGRIKCIYIDPPYNTGSAFEHYDDNTEHSIWLCLMKKRLEILRNLLSEDGSIAVQIGFDEMAYLKVLMDEIFGRNNCFGQVAVRMSHSAGMKRKAADKRLIKNTEYILFYYKDKLPEITPIYEETNEYPVNYYQYLLEEPTAVKNGKYGNLVDVLYENYKDEFERFNLKKNNNAIKELFRSSEIIRNFIFKNKKRILRKDSNAPKVIDEINVDDNEFIEYNNGEYNYFIGKNSKGNIYQLYSLEDKIKEVEIIDEDGNINKMDSVTNLLGDWWDSFYKDMSRVDIEGGVKMKTSKKPERLIYRILSLTTKPGDFVLDSFLGSATTCAVAHKMNRKWIGIELGEHCYTLSKPRIDNVIDGDKTGISKIVNWKGGGGYKFYELAPNLINYDKFGEYVINKEYNAQMLASAIALHEGFEYSPSSEYFWKQSKSNENSYLFVTTRHVTAHFLDSIIATMKQNEFLIIACTSFEDNIKNYNKNIVIKKIPQMLLEKCDFVKENYDLNIINPPLYEHFEEGEE